MPPKRSHRESTKVSTAASNSLANTGQGKRIRGTRGLAMPSTARQASASSRASAQMGAHSSQEPAVVRGRPRVRSRSRAIPAGNHHDSQVPTIVRGRPRVRGRSHAIPAGNQRQPKARSHGPALVTQGQGTGEVFSSDYSGSDTDSLSSHTEQGGLLGDPTRCLGLVGLILGGVSPMRLHHPQDHPHHPPPPPLPLALVWMRIRSWRSPASSPRCSRSWFTELRMTVSGGFTINSAKELSSLNTSPWPALPLTCILVSVCM